MDGHRELLPDHEEQADVQRRAQNLKAHNSFHDSGLIHCQTGGVGPAAAAKEWWSLEIWPRKLAASHVRTTIDKNARATLSSIPHVAAHSCHPQSRLPPAEPAPPAETAPSCGDANQCW